MSIVQPPSPCGPNLTDAQARDRAIAKFFEAATVLVVLCKPLIERAVKQGLEELEQKGRR